MNSALQRVSVSHLAKVSKIRVRENHGPALQPFGVTLALSDFRKNPGPTPIDIAGSRLI